jgi:hypothetical protein
LTLFLASAAHAAEPAGPPDAARGRALFVGATALQKGGAACGACHAIGGQGSLLAASLGPDLTRSFEGLPPEAIDGLLQDLPFPTMVPVYAGRALTPGERADLAAFLSGLSGTPGPSGQGIAVIATAIGGVFLLVLASRARRRKAPTRPTLVARPPSPPPRPAIGRPIGDPKATPIARSAAGGGR